MNYHVLILLVVFTYQNNIKNIKYPKEKPNHTLT